MDLMGFNCIFVRFKAYYKFMRRMTTRKIDSI